MLGSAGGGVELTKVLLGGFVGVELLAKILLSGKHTCARSMLDANKEKT